MLVIRQNQIDAMLAADDGDLQKLVADAIRVVVPERAAAYEPDTFAAMIDIAIARARSHELSKAEDIAAFAAAMFEIAPNFDEQPEIKAVLDDTNFPPGERFYQTFERAGDEAWAEAEKRYDELIWFAAKRG